MAEPAVYSIIDNESSDDDVTEGNACEKHYEMFEMLPAITADNIGHQDGLKWRKFCDPKDSVYWWCNCLSTEHFHEEGNKGTLNGIHVWSLYSEPVSARKWWYKDEGNWFYTDTGTKI